MRCESSSDDGLEVRHNPYPRNPHRLLTLGKNGAWLSQLSIRHPSDWRSPTILTVPLPSLRSRLFVKRSTTTSSRMPVSCQLFSSTVLPLTSMPRFPLPFSTDWHAKPPQYSSQGLSSHASHDLTSKYHFWAHSFFLPRHSI